MSRWKFCDKSQPDSERQVLIARPDKDEVEAGHWFEPEQAWVLAGTHEQVWPTSWREMPRHPFNHD